MHGDTRAHNTLWTPAQWVKIYKSTWYHEPEHSHASARSRNAWAYWPLTISLKFIRRGYPQYRFGQQVQVPWSWRLRRRTVVGSLEVNNQLFALIWVHLGIFVSRLLLYCCMLQLFGSLKACICSHTMAITGPNDYIGSAGLTNRNRRSSGKIFGSQRLDETWRRINKFYNYCS